jgi:hypothetical protein
VRERERERERRPVYFFGATLVVELGMTERGWAELKELGGDESEDGEFEVKLE